MTNGPIDPLVSPKYRLEGRVVTMDDGFRVLESGTVHIDSGTIAALTPGTSSPPAGFEDSPLIRTGGTIYPGLIELHNHLSYNVLPLWQVPRPFSNRGQWGRLSEYRKRISGPMQILGRAPGMVEAIVRYVECKCLLGGVTTSQGIALFSNQGIRRYYRGIVRNVEETNESDLPEAKTRISDVDATEVERFRERLDRSSCLLLHLSEGIDEKARQHFLALQMGTGEWAITPALAGIHCAGLHEVDFSIVQRNGGSMIWSPLSNLLLYGNTAKVAQAKSDGVLIGIGSDWSPTGSKNLLGELKVAHLVSQHFGGIFTPRELLGMATINAAKILKWDAVIGSIEAGKRADLLVLAGRRKEPYKQLLAARETSIVLVVINGAPRYGQGRLMRSFSGEKEALRVGDSERELYLVQQTADPIVGKLTLSEARLRLQDAMSRLPELAREAESPEAALEFSAMETAEPRWFLVLDHAELPGEAFRPHLPFGAEGIPTGVMSAPETAQPLSQIVAPIQLSGLTVADDPRFLDEVTGQPNLPDYVRDGLAELY